MIAWGGCRVCNRVFATYHDFAVHEPCGTFPGEEITVSTRRSYAQWSDNDAVLVHVADDPSTPEDVRIRYVGDHKAKLKPGYHREYIRSLPQMNKFEREHGVTNHVMHFDNNGRAVDDHFRGEKITH